MAMKIIDLIKHKVSLGYYGFSIEEVIKEIPSSRVSILASLRRLEKKGEIISVYQGFYIVVPDEFKLLGCLPADQLIVLLMDYLKIDYYVCLLSAAAYYGASHQQSQTFQVMLEKNRKNIVVKTTNIEFVANKNVKQFSIRQFNNPRGLVKVSSPETTAIDMINYPQRCGGLNNVATVLSELTESVNEKELSNLANKSSETIWIRRLGYLFEIIGNDRLAIILEKSLVKKRFNFQPLSIIHPFDSSLSKSERWKLIINTQIESDL